MDLYHCFQPVCGDCGQTPRDEASKQVLAATVEKASKKKGNGLFDVKMSTGADKYSCKNE